jgi:hypothetical protein
MNMTSNMKIAGHHQLIRIKGNGTAPTKIRMT